MIGQAFARAGATRSSSSIPATTSSGIVALSPLRRANDVNQRTRSRSMAGASVFGRGWLREIVSLQLGHDDRVIHALGGGGHVAGGVVDRFPGSAEHAEAAAVEVPA